MRALLQHQQAWLHSNPFIFDAANVRPKVVVSASHEEWVISLIKAGLGISIMPQEARVNGDCVSSLLWI